MRSLKAFAVGVATALALPLATVTLAHAEPAEPTPTTTEQSETTIDVVVMLKNQPSAPSLSTESSLLANQDALIEAWSQELGLEVTRQFAYLVNGFSASVPASKITALANKPEVASVRRERIYYPTEHNARDMHGVPTTYADHGADGTGTVISIIDTGIDLSHQDMRLDDGVCEESKLTPDTANGFTCKVPFGYNYADESYEVLDTTGSEHGQHVAGIAAANGSEGDVPADVAADGRIDGAAPNAQLLAMKVFSNSGEGGAFDADIIAAIEDSVKLGADVINMSLGSPNGQNDSSDGTHRAIEQAREAGVLVVVSAGNEGLNYSPSGGTDDAFGYLDDATAGTPGTQGSAFTIASIDNSVQTNEAAYWNDGTDHEIPHMQQVGSADGQSYEIVDIGLAEKTDVEGLDLSGKYALVERGTISFSEKFENAISAGAAGVIVFNSAEGGNDFVGMAGLEPFMDTGVFGTSILREDGVAIREALAGGEVTARFTNDLTTVDASATLTPSSFTSWGPTPTLDFEPDIAGVGGSVYSTLNDNLYGTKSGTSMAAPNIAGLSALVFQDYRLTYPDLSGPALLDRIETALMNTAQIPVNEAGVPFAPRQVGAGLARIDHALDTTVFATVEGRPSVPLREVNGPVSFTVDLINHGSDAVTYSVPTQEVLSETNTAGEETTTAVSGESLTANVSEVTVPAGGSAQVTFTLTPAAGEDRYIQGWARFEGQGAPDLAVPYLGFVGDWNADRIVGEPGEYVFGEEVAARTSLVTTWGGQTIPLDIMADMGGKPFWHSPNGDGDMDVVNPALLLLRNAYEARYTVLDSNGEVVRVIGTEQTLWRSTLSEHLLNGSGTEHVATSHGFDGQRWNPSTKEFEVVPDGQYTFRVETRLGEEFGWQVTDLPFGVDTVPPEIAFGELEGTTLSFTVVEEGSGLIDLPTITTADGTELTPTETGDGSFTVEVPEGTPYVTVTAIDYGQSLAVATKVLGASALYVDGVDTYESEDLGPNSWAVADDMLTVSGYASADIVRVTVGAEEVSVTSGRFSAEVPLQPGQNEFTVTGYNEAGDEVDQVTITPFYDVEPPVVEVTNLNADGQVDIAEDGSVTVTGVVTDSRTDSDRIVVTINGDEVPVAADGTFSHTYTPTPEDFFVLVTASEHYNDTTEVYQLAGREVPAGFSWVPPTVTNAECRDLSVCFAPTSGEDVTEDSFTMRGRIEAPVGEFTITPGNSVGADGQYVDPDPIPVTIFDDGTFEVTLPNLSTGINDFRGYITDENGDVRFDGHMSVYFDVTAPSVAFDEPTLTGGTLFTSDPNVTFAGTASDDGWGYELYLNDSSVLEVYYNSGLGPESNERTFSVDVTVADGDELLLQFNDSFGNVLIGLIPVVLDQAAPQIDFSIEDQTLITDGSPVTTTATDDHLRSLAVYLNGEEVSNQVTDVTTDSQRVEEILANAADLVDVPEEDEEQTPGADQERAAQTTADGAEASPAEDEEADANEDATDQATEETGSFGAYGMLTDTAETTLSYDVATADLAPGRYTVTSVSTDLAGNETTESITFRVDGAPVISGEDTVDLTVDREVLGDQEKLADLILEQYTAEDDGTWNGAENATLSLAPTTVLVEGENTVTIIATDGNGMSTTREVTVTITLNEYTLSDQGVTATGTFRSDDELTVTISGTNPKRYEISNREDFATLDVVLTIPGPEGATIYRVDPSGTRFPVEATYADGVYTFTGPSKGVYEVQVPVDQPDPGTDPGTGPGTDPGTGPGTDPGTDPGTGPGTDPGTDPGSGSPQKPGGAGPSKPLSHTGFDATSLVAVSVLFTGVGVLLLAVRRRMN